VADFKGQHVNALTMLADSSVVDTDVVVTQSKAGDKAGRW